MIEHLTSSQADVFFHEAFRVMKSGAWIRIGVPDLKRLAAKYVQQDGDADAFIRSMFLCPERPRGYLQKLRSLMVGPRHHLWMYDGASLKRRLEQCGFVGATEVPPGNTKMPDVGRLDLAERAEETVYVEAQKP
jgi:predicted SAM-dependent methyltransferase